MIWHIYLGCTLSKFYSDFSELFYIAKKAQEGGQRSCKTRWLQNSIQPVSTASSNCWRAQNGQTRGIIY